LGTGDQMIIRTRLSELVVDPHFPLQRRVVDHE